MMPKQTIDKTPTNLKSSNRLSKNLSDLRDSPESKSSYQSKLKEEDGIIK
jgi:hypothetical protein